MEVTFNEYPISIVSTCRYIGHIALENQSMARKISGNHLKMTAWQHFQHHKLLKKSRQLRSRWIKRISSTGSSYSD
jgi:hypothetical protein